MDVLNVRIINDLRNHSGGRMVTSQPWEGWSMEIRMCTEKEAGEMIRQANHDRAVKAAATRRVRQWLERLYRLEDLRG